MGVGFRQAVLGCGVCGDSHGVEEVLAAEARGGSHARKHSRRRRSLHESSLRSNQIRPPDAPCEAISTHNTRNSQSESHTPLSPPTEKS